MKSIRSLILLAGFGVSATVGLGGCAKESRTERTNETISTPTGTTTTTSSTKVSSTGEHPPENRAGETGKAK